MSSSGFDFDFGEPFGSGAAPTAPVADSASIPAVVVDSDQAVRSRLAMQLGEVTTSVATIDGLRDRLHGDSVGSIEFSRCKARRAKRRDQCIGGEVVFQHLTRGFVGHVYARMVSTSGEGAIMINKSRALEQPT